MSPDQIWDALTETNNKTGLAANHHPRAVGANCDNPLQVNPDVVEVAQQNREEGYHRPLTTESHPVAASGQVAALSQGIRQTFTLPASPQQNGIAERRIGMYAAHQINLQPRVSLPETSPTLRWTGKVGDASAFRVWGSRAFVRDLSADKLSFRAVPCVFFGFPPDTPGWQFYHPTSRRVLSSQDATFDESVPYYHLFPYRTAPLPPPPLFLAPDAVEPVEVAADSGASRGAEPERAEPGGAEPERAEPGGAASGGAEPGVAGSGGVEPTGAGLGGPSGALSRRELPSPQELREWFARHWSRAGGAGGAAGAGGSAAAGGTGAGGAAGEGAGATGPGGARTGGTGATGPSGGATGGAGAGGAAGVDTTRGTGAGAAVSAGGPAGAGAARGPGAGGAAGVGADAGGAGVVPAGSGGVTWTRPYFVPLLEQVLGLPPSSSPLPGSCPGELRSYLSLQITRDRARRIITLTQSHMVHEVLQRFDFTYSSPQATPLSTRHSLSALPSYESVDLSGPYPELVGCLMYLMTCTRPDLAYPLSILARFVAPGRHRPEYMAAAKRVLRYLCSTSGLGLVLGGRSPVVLTGHADASWVDDMATQRSSQGYTFSLGSGSVSWRSTRSSSVLSSSCEAEIYAGAMAAHELRWLTYLLTDLGEPPRSPPVLYVDNKAMLALCREHRLEHRTKHIALLYFLARELQQRGQLRLAYMASQANTADIFTKALQPCDHQRFCTMLGLLALLCFA
ncbi:unnamed protein product [Closterium sp. NIES-53]